MRCSALAKPELVAAAFRSRGAEELRKEELVQELAFSLHLMLPSDAADAIDAALASGLLAQTGEQLRLAGEAGSDVETPTTESAVDVPDLFHRVVATVVEATGETQREVIRSVNRRQKEHYGIRPETEALLLAADAGVDVAPFLDEARQGLVRRARD